MNNFFDLYFYKSTNNTNDKLKEIRESNSNTNIALLSIIQNNGKGRSGKVWLSNKGDLTCSFLINQSLPFKNLGRINMIIINVLLNFKNFKTLSNIKYKWPNDIQINGKKISGILIETFSNEKNIESFIIGLGINLVSSPKIKLNKTISLAKLNINIDPVDVFFLLKKRSKFFFKKF